MLERSYQNAITQRRLVDGPAGPWLDGFAETLRGEGCAGEGLGGRIRGLPSVRGRVWGVA